MATVFALEVADIGFPNPLIELIFSVKIVDQNAGSVSSQVMAVYVSGAETPDEFRDAVVSQLTAQIAMYFPSVTVAPSDFVIVNVQRGA